MSVSPVVIVGGGPAGLAAAAELHLHGIDSIVIEPRAEVSAPAPASEDLTHRRVPHRWSTCAGGASPMRCGRQRHSRSPGRSASHSASRCPEAGSPTSTMPSGSPTGPRPPTRYCQRSAVASKVVLAAAPQPVVEEVLRGHLRAAGVDVRLGHSATSLSQDPDGVTLTVRDGAGAEYRLRARYLLGCDGAGGIVRDQIGAQYIGALRPRPNLQRRVPCRRG